ATSNPGHSIFVDWNNDGVFAVPEERMFTTAAYIFGSAIGSFTVPPGTPPGNYRVRVVVNWNATTPTPCNTSINGEAEDYTFIVVTPPSCLTPFGLTFSQASLTSANVSWAASTS
ncbi:GEVED domain-containing protein, partial [Arthrospira platensis SPKY2]